MDWANKILSGPLNEIVTLGGIKDYHDSLYSDNLMSVTMVVHVIIRKGTTHKYHFLEQWMIVAQQQVIGESPEDVLIDKVIKQWVIRQNLASLGRKLVAGSERLMCELDLKTERLAQVGPCKISMLTTGAWECLWLDLIAIGKVVI